jgi:hypothetical protein
LHVDVGFDFEFERGLLLTPEQPSKMVALRAYDHCGQQDQSLEGLD